MLLIPGGWLVQCHVVCIVLAVTAAQGNCQLSVPLDYSWYFKESAALAVLMEDSFIVGVVHGKLVVSSRFSCHYRLWCFLFAADFDTRGGGSFNEILDANDFKKNNDTAVRTARRVFRARPLITLFISFIPDCRHCSTSSSVMAEPWQTIWCAFIAVSARPRFRLVYSWWMPLKSNRREGQWQKDDSTCVALALIRYINVRLCLVASNRTSLGDGKTDRWWKTAQPLRFNWLSSLIMEETTPLKTPTLNTNSAEGGVAGGGLLGHWVWCRGCRISLASVG